MLEIVRHVMALLDHKCLDLRDIFILCQTCKDMHAVITENHGPVRVNVVLDVQHMCTAFEIGIWDFNAPDLTYNVDIEHTRKILTTLSTFNVKYRVCGLSMNYCHCGHKARLISTPRTGCHDTALLTGVQDLRFLQRVDISNVHISTQSVCDYLTTFAGTDLSLVQCGLQVDDSLFAILSRIPGLILLSLSGNAFCLREEVSEVPFRTLKVLNCSDCVSVDALLLLRMGLHETLEELCWDDNYIADNSKNGLFTWLSTCKRLNRLHLRNTHLLWHDSRDLVQALLCLPDLRCIDLSYNEFKESVDAFIQVMPRLRQLYISVMRGLHAHMIESWRTGRTAAPAPGDILHLDDEFELEDLEVDVE